MKKVYINTSEELYPVVTFDTEIDRYEDNYPEISEETLARWEKTWEEWESLQQELQEFWEEWEQSQKPPKPDIKWRQATVDEAIIFMRNT